MKVTIDGIQYEGTEDEIRRIVSDPPTRPHVQINGWPPDNGWLPDNYPRNWDGTPKVTCTSKGSEAAK